MAKRASPMCRELTKTTAQKLHLVNLYNDSLRSDREVLAHICSTKKGSIVVPVATQGFKEGRWPFIAGYGVDEVGKSPCETAGLKLRGDVHTHPSKWKADAPYFGAMDLTDVAKGESVCIIFREANNLKLKCTEALRKEPIITAAYDVEDQPEFKKDFSTPCNVRVTSGLKRSLRSRLPWRKF